MSKILLVEDDSEIRQIEKDYLIKEGFLVVEARNGKEAVNFFSVGNFDLVILDLNLPLMDGIDVCREIRKTSGVPIIMVTARTKELDELVGLDVGADDYVKKPFSPKVLVARVKSLLKRPEIKEGKNIIESNGLVIDLEKRTVQIEGVYINLTSVQFNILSFLAQNPGHVFERSELIDRGYDSNIPPDIFDRTIDSHIKNIRKQIEKDPKEPKYLLTVRGVGYKFAESVSVSSRTVKHIARSRRK